MVVLRGEREVSFPPAALPLVPPLRRLVFSLRSESLDDEEEVLDESLELLELERELEPELLRDDELPDELYEWKYIFQVSPPAMKKLCIINMHLLLESLLEEAEPRRLRSRSLRDELDVAAFASFSLTSFSLFSFSPSAVGDRARALIGGKYVGHEIARGNATYTYILLLKFNLIDYPLITCPIVNNMLAKTELLKHENIKLNIQWRSCRCICYFPIVYIDACCKTDAQSHFIDILFTRYILRATLVK